MLRPGILTRAQIEAAAGEALAAPGGAPCREYLAERPDAAAQTLVANAATQRGFSPPIDGTFKTSGDGWAHDHAHTPGLFWWQYRQHW